jgi:hypothetical protein
MAVVRNISRSFNSGSGNINTVINDYKKFVENIQSVAEGKVKEAVIGITNLTNNKYSGDNLDQRIQLTLDPIYYQVSSTTNVITGTATAKPIREFIYLEFGTRQHPGDTLAIRTNWRSGIDAISVSAPYKSDNPKFYFKEGPIRGRYYFLNTIDQKGMEFIRNFWK